MDWEQILAIIGVNIALAGIMISIIVWITSKHDTEMNRVITRIDGHAARMDQLYSMFVDLLKEGRK